jgi:AcrR family transcriptional regulator
MTMATTSDRRTRRREQTRERIVRAAVELFVSQGYDATTVDQIATAPWLATNRPRVEDNQQRLR